MARKKGSRKRARAGRKGAAARMPEAPRKRGLMEVLNSDATRSVLADVLLAAAAAAATALVRHGPSLKQMRRAGSAVADAGAGAAAATRELAESAGGAVAGAVRKTTRRVLPSVARAARENGGSMRAPPRGAGTKQRRTRNRDMLEH